MAVRRYRGKGEFTDRDGNVLRLTAFTAEVVEPVADEGDIGGGLSSSPGNEQEGMGGAGGNPEVALFADGADASPAPAATDDVTVVWDCYVETMQPRRADLLPAERKIINDALKAASVTECREAIIGCSRSAFHMGDNDRKRKYNRLSQIIKGRQGKETTRERIDYFIDIFHNPTKTDAPLTSEALFKINTLKDRVRRGNGNDDGQKAEAELWERYEIKTVWRRTGRGDSDVFAPVFERGDQAA